jgi:FKBP-type peptidyl-prolyl cis-trans isomerase
MIIAALMLPMMASCAKEKLENTYNKQDETIDKYIESNRKEGMTVTYRNGSARLTKVQGEGAELSTEGSVSFYYAGYTFKGNISSAGLFATNHEQTATDAKWSLDDPDYEVLEIDMKDGRLLEGVRNGLVGVRAGEECEILFCGKYGFGNETFGIIPANSALAFKIWVVSVSNN